MIDETLNTLLNSIITTAEIYADVPPDNQPYPQVVYDIVSTVDELAIDESGITDSISRIQVDVRANTRAEAITLSDTLNATLSGYRGVVAGKRIDLIKRLDRRTIVDKKLKLYRIVQDFMVHH
ncbi:MAG: DUF3168 domain-containing protein [Pseudomonadales bacterium]|nr:DUF3168 domain-containing protein [Pseudomonadales bacterium]